METIAGERGGVERKAYRGGVTGGVGKSPRGKVICSSFFAIGTDKVCWSAEGCADAAVEGDRIGLKEEFY